MLLDITVKLSPGWTTKDPVKTSPAGEPDEELKVDKVLTKKIMYHIQKFISRRNVTKKSKPTNASKRKTRKKK